MGSLPDPTLQATSWALAPDAEGSDLSGRDALLPPLASDAGDCVEVREHLLNRQPHQLRELPGDAELVRPLFEGGLQDLVAAKQQARRRPGSLLGCCLSALLSQVPAAPSLPNPLAEEQLVAVALSRGGDPVPQPAGMGHPQGQPGWRYEAPLRAHRVPQVRSRDGQREHVQMLRKR